MTDRFIDSLNFTLKWEGGFVNDPSDSGGATNFGITQAVYDSYRRSRKQAATSVKEIQRQEVLDIYRTKYWLAGHCDRMPAPVDCALFDSCVNFGVRKGAMFLQQALGVALDGLIGQQTLSAMAAAHPVQVAVAICNERIEFRYARVKKNATQGKFLAGWLNRDNALKRLCLTATKPPSLRNQSPYRS